MAAVAPVDTNPAGTLTRAADPAALTVYASKGGRRYHAGRDCRALTSAQDLWDWDPDVWVPGMPTAYLTSGHAVWPMTALDALGEGKTPCAVCFPGSGAALARSSAEDDHGHEPGDWDTQPVCRRCRTRHIDEDGERYTIPAFWPCTTAVVLGLTVREVA